MADALARFEQHLRSERGLSEHTVRAYRGDVADPARARPADGPAGSRRARPRRAAQLAGRPGDPGDGPQHAGAAGRRRPDVHRLGDPHRAAAPPTPALLLGDAARPDAPCPACSAATRPTPLLDVAGARGRRRRPRRRCATARVLEVLYATGDPGRRARAASTSTTSTTAGARSAGARQGRARSGRSRSGCPAVAGARRLAAAAAARRWSRPAQRAGALPRRARRPARPAGGPRGRPRAARRTCPGAPDLGPHGLRHSRCHPPARGRSRPPVAFRSCSVTLRSLRRRSTPTCPSSRLKATYEQAHPRA